MTDHDIITYTDGACKGNPGPEGQEILQKLNLTKEELENLKTARFYGNKNRPRV